VSLTCTPYLYSAVTRTLVILLATIMGSQVYSQNLLHNGGFEEINICTEYTAPCAPESWFNMRPANIPTVNKRLAPKPLLGDQAFLLPIYDVNQKSKPLVYTMLLCPLQKGKQYKLSFYLYTANRSFYNIDFAFLEKEPVTIDFDPYAVTPDFKIDRTNIAANIKGWSAVEHIFTATSDARFLMLGNINSFAAMNYKQTDGMNRPGMVYYFIDEIVLRSLIPEAPCIQMEKNKEKLYRQDLRHTEYVVVETEPEVNVPEILIDTLVLPSVLFRTGSSIIEKNFSGILDSLIQKLSQKTVQKIKIIGHTDSRGQYADNISLSQKRAIAVKQYILSRLPIQDITSEGKADTAPVAANNTDAGRMKNRRVELIVTYSLIKE
jgi:outer membrane protein OmpA-like peptidoglycan-associated protein